MSVGVFTLADASIAQIEVKDGGMKKAPPKRTVTALKHQHAVPEPR